MQASHANLYAFKSTLRTNCIGYGLSTWILLLSAYTWCRLVVQKNRGHAAFFRIFRKLPKIITRFLHISRPVYIEYICKKNYSVYKNSALISLQKVCKDDKVVKDIKLQKSLYEYHYKIPTLPLNSHQGSLPSSCLYAIHQMAPLQAVK